jgi:hypothetical protein
MFVATVMVSHGVKQNTRTCSIITAPAVGPERFISELPNKTNTTLTHGNTKMIIEQATSSAVHQL